jgi:hypothetical protein
MRVSIRILIRYFRRLLGSLQLIMSELGIIFSGFFKWIFKVLVFLLFSGGVKGILEILNWFFKGFLLWSLFCIVNYHRLYCPVAKYL